MYFNQDYSDRVLKEVEDLASRVHLLKERLTKENVSAKLNTIVNLPMSVAASP